MNFGNPEYFNVKQLKDAQMWPFEWLPAYGIQPYIKRMKGDTLTGIEVGVLKAETVHVLLTENPRITKIYGIDNFKVHTDYETVRTEEDMINYERICKENTEEFGDRFELIKEDSDKAASRFDKESIDFIHVDGDHTKEGVKADLKNYYPLLKKGGYIFIHDFQMRLAGPLTDGVKEFKTENKITVPISISKNFIAFWIKS